MLGEEYVLPYGWIWMRNNQGTIIILTVSTAGQTSFLYIPYPSLLWWSAQSMVAASICRFSATRRLICWSQHCRTKALRL